MKKLILLFVGLLFIVSAGISYAKAKKCHCKEPCPANCTCSNCTCPR